MRIDISLADACMDVSYGYTASASSDPVGPKFLRITDIVPSSINWEEVPFCKISAKDQDKYKLKVNDIVIARTGATTGYAKLIRKNTESVYASYLIRLRLKPEFDAKFIGNLIESSIYKDFVWQHIGGAAQPNANAKVLTSFRFSCPQLAEQKKIGTIMELFNNLIGINERKTKVLEKMARRLYREWFIDFKYPGYEKVKMVDSGHADFGMIPEGWAARKVSDEIELVYGKALKEENRKGGRYPVYGSGGVVGYHSSYLLEGPGIVVGRKGSAGSVFWTDESYYPIDTAYGVKSRLPLLYVYFDFLSREFIIGDTAVPGLNRDYVYGLPLLVPSDEVLRQFCQSTETIFELRSNCIAMNRVLKEMRDLLLPKLISGEIDVSELKLDGIVEDEVKVMSTPPMIRSTSQTHARGKS